MEQERVTQRDEGEEKDLEGFVHCSIPSPKRRRKMYSEREMELITKYFVLYI